MNIVVKWPWLLAVALLWGGAQAKAQSQIQAPVNGNAQRIIALSPHAVEMLFAIGAGDRIVATTDHADYPEQAKAITSVGGYYGVQLERIVALKPDLIVTWEGGNRAEDLAMLKKLGFNTFSSDPKTLDEVATELIKLGELTGREAQATQVAADFSAAVAALRVANQAKPKVRFFYELWSQPLMTAGKGSWVQQLAEVCQGENLFLAAKGQYPQVSIEAVLTSKPQAILIAQEQAATSPINWQQWQEVPAVANGHIYYLNPDLLHRAGPRAVEGIEAMCQALDSARKQPSR